MKQNTRRSILRWIHIVLGLAIIGYIYGPQEEVQQYVNVHRFFIVPALVLSGLWLWKGPAIRRLFVRDKEPS